MARKVDIPFRPVAHAVLHNLCLGDGANLLEELLQLASAEASGQLLDKNGASVTLVASGGRVARRALSRATAVIIAAAIAAVVAVAVPVAAVVSLGAVAVGRAGAGATST